MLLSACGPVSPSVIALLQRSAVPAAGARYTGLASPALPGERAVLQRSYPTGWVDTASASVASDGRFDLDVPPAGAHPYNQRVQTRTAAGVAQAVSIASQYGAAPVPVSAAIADWLHRRSGSASVAVYDASSGVTSLYNPAGRYYFASTRKLAILGALLARTARARSALSPLEQSHATPMIEQSSNADATWLWNHLGATTGIADYERSVGLTQTSQDSHGRWGLATTSALDELALLQTLASPNPLLRPTDQSYAGSLLSHIVASQSWGVSAGAPATATVQLKNGWLPHAGQWTVNSVGRITAGSQQYDLAVLTATPSTALSSFNYGIATVEGVARLLWNQQPALPGRLKAAPDPHNG